MNVRREAILGAKAFLVCGLLALLGGTLKLVQCDRVERGRLEGNLQGAHPCSKNLDRMVMVVVQVDAQSGLLVEYADVWYAAIHASDDAGAGLARSVPMTQLHSDERGVVRLNVVSGSVIYVGARKGSLAGYAVCAVDSSNARVVVRLRDSVCAAVQVLGSDGRPASGVCLDLRCNGRRWATSTTGPDGMVVWGCADAPMGGSEEYACEIVPHLLMGEEGRLQMPEGQPMHVYRLPYSGSVRVRVRDLDGETVNAGSASLRVAMGKGKYSLPIREKLAREVVFSRVPLEHDLILAVARGTDGAMARQVIAGPRHNNEEVQVNVILSATNCILELCVRQEDGLALASEEIEVYFIRDDGSGGKVSARTDRDGVCRVDLTANEEGRITQVGISSWRGRELAAKKEVNLPLSAGVVDAGTFILGDAPLYMRVRVIDLNGDPVRCASLFLDLQSVGVNWARQVEVETDVSGIVEYYSGCLDEEIMVRISRLPGCQGEMAVIRPGGDEQVLLISEE